MSWSRVVPLALVVSLALPAGLFQALPMRAPQAGATLSLAASAGSVAAATTSNALGQQTDTRRKNDARERSARDARDRKPPRNRDRNRNKPQVHVEPTKQELREQSGKQCDGPGMISLPKSGLCTHGPDPAPPGVDLTRRAAPEPRATARVATEALTCDGDGQSGYRVQVLYVRAANVPSHYTRYLDSIRAWAAGIDDIVQQSAADAGGGRRVRFVTTPGCEIDVPQVVLSPTGDDGFGSTIVQLKDRGYDREDRIYLAFVDTLSAGICGVANFWPDDRPSQANASNSGSSFARIDAGCWSVPDTPAHELMHSLGAVQDSAPNISGAGHCIDEWDVMCYSDAPLFPAMRFDCPNEAMERRLDCGHDDYFHPAPPPGSYLATHWNTANSRFLIASDPGTPDTEPPVVTWTTPVGNRQVHTVRDGTIALEVAVSDNRAVSRLEFTRFDEVRQKWFDVAMDRSAPYTASLNVSELQPGYAFVAAEAFDSAANSTREHIWIENERTTPPDDPPPEPTPTYATVTITAPGNGAKLKPSSSATIEVVVANAPGAGVEVRACPANAFCSWRTAAPIGSDASAPFAVPWRVPGSGRFDVIARANDADETLSEPVSVSVEQETAKKKKNKKKKR